MTGPDTRPKSAAPSAVLTAERHDCGSPTYRLGDGRRLCVECGVAE